MRSHRRPIYEYQCDERLKAIVPSLKVRQRSSNLNKSPNVFLVVTVQRHESTHTTNVGEGRPILKYRNSGILCKNSVSPNYMSKKWYLMTKEITLDRMHFHIMNIPFVSTPVGRESLGLLDHQWIYTPGIKIVLTDLHTSYKNCTSCRKYLLS